MTTGITQLSGLGRITMTYAEGGKFEVWTMSGTSVRVPAGTSSEEVKRLLIEKAGT